MATTISYSTKDRQWDARFNINEKNTPEQYIASMQKLVDRKMLRYGLISGIEIGTRPNHTDYQRKHVHLAIVYNNKASKGAILKHFDIDKSTSYYLVPRNRDLPISGWREHHIKLFSKVDPDKRILFEYGELPTDSWTTRVQASENEKKRKLDDIIRDMRTLIEEEKYDECFEKFPRNYLTYGEKIKAMVTQKLPKIEHPQGPHLWVYGYPGSGKTALMEYIYPNHYKKNLDTKFYDLFDQKTHTHMLLEDLDPDALERLGLQWLKTLTNEGGFPIDQKYKTPQLAKTTVLITSNFTINECLPIDLRGVPITLAALYRRFYHLKINVLLRILSIRLIPLEDRQQLKKEGNEDRSKIFMSWDWDLETPTGKPIPTPMECQELIRNKYYS